MNAAGRTTVYGDDVKAASVYTLPMTIHFYSFARSVRLLSQTDEAIS